MNFSRHFASFIVSAMLMSATTISAGTYTYPYLTLRTSDGQATALDVKNLEITFGNGKLYATNDKGTTTLDLTQLSSMRFTKSDAQPGDIDGDGNRSIGDVTALINVVVGNTGVTSADISFYDVNGDSTIDDKDLIELLNIILEQ